MIKRFLEKNIMSRLFKGKAIIILGARQVGKTTLINSIIKKKKGTILFNGDESDIREIFKNPTSTKLKTLIGDKELVVIDEAQNIENIGLALKLLIDNYPKIQIIATGSSAFELSNSLNEPLTGRKYEYELFPLSFGEMSNSTSVLEEKRLLEHRLIYGYYPEIVTKPNYAKELLMQLTNSYLYRDILNFSNIKKHAKLHKLVQALALQIGNEVSFNELANLVGLNQETVENYIDILEKSFVIFRLTSLSRNIRNELKKSNKFYFYDNGVRNAVIKYFNNLTIRADVGALWENFIIIERMKRNQHIGKFVNSYFWRTTSQQEIDYIEEDNGVIYAYEFKWNKNKKAKGLNRFLKGYPNSKFEIISPENFEKFIL